jgi:hypothetical protein
VTISQNFVAFSEYMNLTKTILRSHLLVSDRKSFRIFLVVADFVPSFMSRTSLDLQKDYLGLS